jgi:hypothetical protein
MNIPRAKAPILWSGVGMAKAEALAYLEARTFQKREALLEVKAFQRQEPPRKRWAVRKRPGAEAPFCIASVSGA